MIGRLRGRVALRGPDHVMLDVGGVGYVVHCSERTLAALPGPGAVAEIWTELLVREDLMQLFGFLSPAEREWHRLLTSVQGVGARVSLAILGALGTEGVARAIALGDAGAMRKAPGVGPKLAQRVVNELRDKAAGVIALGLAAPATPVAEASGAGADGDLSTLDGLPPVAAPSAQPAPAASAEALSALVNLGYSHGEAAAAVADAAVEMPDDGTAALIRAALRRLAPKA
ncbi:MAG: Holliday junction branch migration protein RuvA [Rhodobacteraceae bacterium]|nr:Holliday junction branch migration protein RuvA [Paracoccaceae bacterium]